MAAFVVLTMDTILAPAGAICFAVIVLAMHRWRPDVNWQSQGISQYAVGPNGWLMAIGFAALAVGILARAVPLHGLAAWSARLASAGFLGVALLPTGGPARRERAHAICALVGFLGTAIAAALSAGTLGLAVVVTTAAFLVAFRDARSWAGLFQRAAFAAIVLWVIVK